MKKFIGLSVLVLLLVGAAHGDQNQTREDNKDQEEDRGQGEEKKEILIVVPLVMANADKNQNQEDNPDQGEKNNENLVQAPSNNASSDVCVLPMVVGACRAAIPRYFYDVTNQSCRSFIYGGCGANGNNFLSQTECDDTCRGVTAPPSVKESSISVTTTDSEDSAFFRRLEKSTDPINERCWVEPEAGPCRAAFKRWFFNQRVGSCQSFTYGGCRGNQNNYQSEQSCMASCSGTAPPSAKVSGNEPDKDQNVCSLTSDPGPCRAAFPMFFYRPATQSCHPFIYGGCQGNLNRFPSEEACLSRCQENGDSDGRDQSRSSWTPAVFLFVALAVISVLILSTLIIVTLRRHRLPRRTSSVSDKEELLSDNQSVDSIRVSDTSGSPTKA